MMTFTMRS